MSLFDPINNYCERSGPGLWDEPLNAFSNIAFFIAAWMLWKRYARRQADKPVALLIALLALVGTGSTLFHTFANGLAMLGDIIPIAIFTYTYLWVVLRRLMHFSKMKTAGILLFFTGMAALIEQAPPALRFNGSIDYFPCLAALFIIGIALRKREPQAGALIFRAACWFTTSILYRSIDMQLCPVFHIGTHFIWHSINGWVLYLLVKAVAQRT